MLASSALAGDTQAILLLCAHLTGNRDAAKPLTAREYSAVAEVLHQQGARPADLIERDPALIRDIVERIAEPRMRIDEQRLDALLRRGAAVAFAMERWSADGIWICSRGDERYPKRYRKRLGKHAPPLLYVLGDGALLNAVPAVAIVGSRDITDDEHAAAVRFGLASARAGAAVVSGAARGSDEAGMIGALEAGGTVVAVLCDNFLRTALTRPYREAIAKNRMVCTSAFGVETKFSTGNAMARNKLIYALADRTIVIASANGKGGTWPGAVEALERGWSVDVRIGTPASEGNIALIQRGARAIDDAGEPIENRPESAGAGRLWDLVSAALEAMPEHERTFENVASSLDVVPSQAQLWLARFREATASVDASGRKPNDAPAEVRQLGFLP